MANEDLASFEFSHLSLLFMVKKESIKFKKKYISKSSLRDFISKTSILQSLSPLQFALVFDL